MIINPSGVYDIIAVVYYYHKWGGEEHLVGYQPETAIYAMREFRDALKQELGLTK